MALDFAACGAAADAEFVEDLVSRLRYAGMQPIAIVAEQNSAHAAIATGLRLGVLAPLKRSGKSKSETVETGDVQHAKYEPIPKTSVIAPAPIVAAKATIPVELAIEIPVAVAAQSPRENVVQPMQVPTLRPPVETAAVEALLVQRYEGQVRSGQQLYAKGRDLIVTGAAGASSEVIADGSIHIYGRLMGKVIAGASGDRNARIYCLAFGAELVSIAGIFRVFESIPADLRGKSVQIWLDGDKLRFDTLN